MIDMWEYSELGMLNREVLYWRRWGDIKLINNLNWMLKGLLII